MRTRGCGMGGVYLGYAAAIVLGGGPALTLLSLDYQRAAVTFLFLMIAGICAVFFFGLRQIDARRIPGWRPPEADRDAD